MFTMELSKYLELVSLIVLDDSEESKKDFANFSSRYPSPASLKNLTESDKEQLAGWGVGFEKLVAAIELGQMVLRSKTPLLGQAYSSNLLGTEMMDRLQDESQESLFVVGTNVHNDIVDIKKMFVGGSNECNVYLDQIFRRLLLHSAHGFAIIHNHPSGKIEPSAPDLNMIKKFQKSSQLLGINFLDFLIIGKDNYYSWRESQAISVHDKVKKDKRND